jgi:hypothetical protein
LDVEKIYKDYNWTPEQGDYHKSMHENTGKEKGKKTTKWYKQINYYYAAIFLSLVVIGILIFK